MEIRLATIKDYDIVNNLLLKLHQFHVDNDPYTFNSIETFFVKREYNKRLKNGNVYFLAEENNRVIGIIGLNVCRNDFIKIVFVNSLFVEENYRNKGIATLLFNEAVKYFKENFNSNEYSDYLNLNVASFNINAIKFYEKIGFKYQSHNMGMKLK